MMKVAPRAGAWIETYLLWNATTGQPASLPARERGLKQLSDGRVMEADEVAPRAGAWIETIMSLCPHVLIEVAPRAGAWIETPCKSISGQPLLVAPRAGAWIETRRIGRIKSHAFGRSPRGSVD